MFDLEQYMIPAMEESMSMKDKIKTGLVLTGMLAAPIAGMAGIAHLEKKHQKALSAEIEKRRAEEEKRKREREEKLNKIYDLKIDAKKAMPNSYIIYSEGKFTDSDSLIDSMEKDLKIGLRKILSSIEITNAFKDMVEEYNKTPNEEQFDRFGLDCPTKLSVNWLKSQFAISVFEEYDDSVYFEVCTGDQLFRAIYGISILYVLGKYIENMYTNYITHVGYGDGDEGCLYIDFDI